MLRLAALAVLGLALATLALACDDGDDEPSTEAAAAKATATDEPSAPAGPATFHVVAGAAEGAYDIEQFMPATVRIREGDSIRWSGSGHEGHTVTLIPDDRIGSLFGQASSTFDPSQYLVPAPDEPGTLEFNQVFALASEAQGSYDGTQYTNSGIFGVPVEDEYELSFPEAGVYPYLCMLHPLNMRGTVIVDEADAEVAAPEAVEAEGQRYFEAFVDEAAEMAQAVEDDRTRVAEGTAERRVWSISAGIDTPHGQVLSFLPAAVEIAAGDTVIFWNSDRDFHNVIFAPEGTDAPQFPIIRPVEGRTPYRLLVNPDAANEVPPPEGFGPNDFFGSGLMGIGWPRQHWKLTFTQPGTYRYQCTVHTQAGMAGVITVR
jgi:plastocyanin